MIELLFIVIAFVLLLLVIIWAHFINQNRQTNTVDNSFRDETNVRLYHEHKAEIEKDFQQGSLDEESYQYLVAELDQSLLQDIEDNSKEAQQTLEKSGQLSLVWPIALSLFVLIFSGYFYAKTGAYELVANTPQAVAGQDEIDEQQQAIIHIQKLRKITEQEPTNSDAWYSLGQALVGVAEFDQALSAFDQVIAIDGELADVYGAKAQATYYKFEQNITPDVQQLIDKALSLDAKDPSTNILLGMHSFMNTNYQQAITHWQLIVDDGRKSVNLDALKSAIAEAKNRLALTGGETDSAANSQGPQLLLKVKASDEIIEQLNQGEDRVVFIYATPTNGSRMPLAAVKIQASDLPIDIVLNDARAMSPQAKLSDVEQVNVYAIISKDGGTGIKPGDFKAEVKNVNVAENQAVNLIIDSLVEKKVE